MAATKLKTAAALVLAMSMVAADQPKAQGEKKARTDLHGDMLPRGALARLGSVRFRYAGWIARLAFSPDGTRLACAGNGGILLWESATGRPQRLLGGRADAVTFLDGGKRIASGGEDLVVWDVADGKEVPRLSIAGGLRHSVYSPDGKLLAGVNRDASLCLVDAVTGEVLKQFDGHEDQINVRPKGAPPRRSQPGSLAFSPDGKSLASACFLDMRVFIWDVATGTVRRTLAGNKMPSVVRFSPDGRLLAVGGDDRMIRLWDPATGRKLQELRGHLGGIRGLAFAPDGLTLVAGAGAYPPNTKGESGGRDYTVRLWDLKTGKARPLPGPKQWATAVAFARDGKTIAAAGSGSIIHLIDVATGKEKYHQSGHEDAIYRLALSPDGLILASGGRDNVVRLWDVHTNRENARLEGHEAHILGLAFTPDGRELVSCGYDAGVRAWDWRGGKEIRRFAQTDRHYGFDLAADGKTLLLPTGQLWNVATGKQTGAVPNWKGWFRYPAVFSPDGKRLAAPIGPVAVVVEVTTGKEICRFAGHEPVRDNQRGDSGPMVNCAAFSHDGRRVVSGGSEGLAFVWDAASGKMQRRLQGHESPVIAVAFSPDGHTAATASGSMWNDMEHTVRLWEVATGKERRRFTGHQAQVTSIVFARDGQVIISGSEDGTALVWDVAGVLNPQTAKERDEEPLWRALAGDDAVAAYEAVCALARRGDVALFAARLRPVAAPDTAKIGRLLADLNSNTFATRQRADRELTDFEELAEPQLRKALAESASLEMRRRAETLLAKLVTRPPLARTLQGLRAVEVLERIATPEARQLLQKLADGTPEARLTREAKAALKRLKRSTRGHQRQSTQTA